jgi:1-acyl-sn-glycerol-3-phosphate acyltransferase
MWYWILRVFVVVVVKTLFRIKVEGKENLPRSNFIAVANHSSFLDSLVLGVAIPKKIHYLVSREIYGATWLQWFMRKSETMPIGNISNKAVDLLASDSNVGLFPEGRVSRDGTLGEFRRGAALLAYKTGRPILPCAILGTFDALPITAKSPRLFTSIKIKIGKPVYAVKEFDDWIDDVYMQELILKVRDAVKEMMDAG